MPRLEATARINAPRERVYEYLLDFSRHPEWAAHPLVIHLDGAAPLQVGSTFKTSAHFMGSHEATVEITDLAPGERIVFESEDNTGRYRHEVLLQQADGGTLLTKTTSQVKASPFNKAFYLLLGPIIGKKGLRQDVSRIKANLESQKG